jgi:hypothetical protein
MNDRKSIAYELMLGCPDESFLDHEKIADAIKSGLFFDDICSTTDIDKWPDTYAWVKRSLEHE